MRPTLIRLAGLATAGYLALSFAALAAPNASMNRDSNVRQSSDPTSEIVNFVEMDQDVQVLTCNATRCKIKIPGPDGWVKASVLDSDYVDDPTPGPNNVQACFWGPLGYVCVNS
mgnify:CR=1 FL=1